MREVVQSVILIALLETVACIHELKSNSRVLDFCTSGLESRSTCIRSAEWHNLLTSKYSNKLPELDFRAKSLVAISVARHLPASSVLMPSDLLRKRFILGQPAMFSCNVEESGQLQLVSGVNEIRESTARLCQRLSVSAASTRG